jgi:hypothetical protein
MPFQQIIGYRRNGTPIRLIQGGSEPPYEGGDALSQSEQGSTPDDAQNNAGGGSGPTAEDIEKLQTALRKERDRAKAGDAAARELAALKASQQTDTEKAIAAAKAEAAKETSSKYAKRLVALSVKAAAAGKFRRPEYATALLADRLNDFVSDDGDVDEKGIAAAVDALLKADPDLGVAQKKAPDFDGGQRNGASGTQDMNRTIRRMAGIQ